jgi:hypothetical protein
MEPMIGQQAQLYVEYRAMRIQNTLHSYTGTCQEDYFKKSHYRFASQSNWPVSQLAYAEERIRLALKLRPTATGLISKVSIEGLLNEFPVQHPLEHLNRSKV